MRGILANVRVVAAHAVIAAALVSGCSGRTVTVTVSSTVARIVVPKAVADPSHPAPQPMRVGALNPVGARLDDFVPYDAKPTGLLQLGAAGGIPQQAVVLWQRDYGQAFPYKQSAFSVWQRGTTWWRRVYTRSASEGRNSAERVWASAADVTNDGHSDVLVFVDTDGSAGGGIHTLFAAQDGGLHALWSARTTHDTDAVFLRGHTLVTYHAIPSSKTTSSPHCCFSRWLRLVRTWPHGQVMIVSRRVTGPPATPVGY